VAELKTPGSAKEGMNAICESVAALSTMLAKESDETKASKEYFQLVLALNRLLNAAINYDRGRISIESLRAAGEVVKTKVNALYPNSDLTANDIKSTKMLKAVSIAVAVVGILSGIGCIVGAVALDLISVGFSTPVSALLVCAGLSLLTAGWSTFSAHGARKDLKKLEAEQGEKAAFNTARTRFTGAVDAYTAAAPEVAV
jgi:hypothetical protein